MTEGEPIMSEEIAEEDSLGSSESQNSNQEIPADQLNDIAAPAENAMTSGGESSGSQSQSEATKPTEQKTSAASRSTTAEKQVSVEEEIEAARGMVEAAADEVNIIGGPTGSK